MNNKYKIFCKGNLSGIDISQGLDWVRPSLSPHFLLESKGVSSVDVYMLNAINHEFTLVTPQHQHNNNNTRNKVNHRLPCVNRNWGKQRTQPITQLMILILLARLYDTD